MKTEDKIIKVYESWNGSYWFFTELDREQEDEFSEHDKIYFGYAVLSGMEDCAEWGYTAEAELLQAHESEIDGSSMVWEVPKSNWYLCKHYDKVIADLERFEK